MPISLIGEFAVMLQRFWRSGLAAVLAGVSLSAAFAAIGFIAALGREQFLGIHLNNWSAETLSLLAGRCAADSLFMSLDFASRHPVIMTICALLVAAALILPRHSKIPKWVPPAVESSLAAAMTITLFILILRYEVPTIQLRGWLIAPNLESPIDKAICDLSPHREGCAKVGSTAAAPGVTKVGTISRRNGDLKNVDDPGVLLLESSSTHAGDLLKDYHFTNPLKPAEALKRLYDRYAFVAMISFLSLFFLSFFTWRTELQVWCDVLTVTRSALVLVSALSTLMIPYVYGKLVDPALFPNAYLQFLQDRPTVTSNQGQQVAGGPPFGEGGSFPVVGQTDTTISVLSIELGTGVTKLIEIPRAKIFSINYTADVDVLAKISECRKGKGDQCQPRPQ
jgi:hypothetical protein